MLNRPDAYFSLSPTTVYQYTQAMQHVCLCSKCLLGQGGYLCLPPPWDPVWGTPFEVRHCIQSVASCPSDELCVWSEGQQQPLAWCAARKRASLSCGKGVVSWRPVVIAQMLSACASIARCSICRLEHSSVLPHWQPSRPAQNAIC